jgi:putative hydrolase of the HAD superfamily
MFEYLILDLDDTLYPRRAGLMQAIVQRIRLYMTDRMGFSKDEAEALHKRFLPQYGTMLRGMQMEYTIDADDYLRFVHDVPIEEYIAPDPALDAMLGRLPLPKVIFTNADTAHARRVMARLGVTHHFASIVDIHALDFHCKPTPQAYRRLLNILGTRGEACIIVEDMARNLRPARELFGMTTVIVDGERADGVDYIIGELSQLEELVHRLMAKK